MLRTCVPLYLFLLGGIASFAVLCGAVRLTAQQKADALREHNVYRCNVSPRAASMPRMVWDNGLEAVAQAFADTCPNGHNSNRTKNYKAITGSTDYVGEVCSV